ncbi:MAG: hypothetical protein WDZ51_08580 [Pirellulaceae bacterium]
MVRIITTAILVATVLCSATLGADNVQPDRLPDLWTPAPFPLPDKATLYTNLALRKERLMKISLPEKIVAGTPCEAQITVTNDSKEVIYSPNARHDINVSIFLVNSRGKTVTPTEYGKQALVKTTLASGLSSEGGRDDLRGGVRIAPGQKHTWAIDVAKCFDLPPNTYTARISIVSLHPGEFVKFEVFPPEK